MPRRRFSTGRRVLAREDGQAAFEFLMVLPLFILFLLLAIDFGVLMYEYVSVSNAVREGARYGSVDCGTGTCSTGLGANGIEQRTIDHSGGILSAGDTFIVGWADNNGNAARNDRGDSVIVKVTHHYEFLFFPATINVTSCADMRLEQKDNGPGTSASRC
jgi:TadE-like protein